MDIFWTLIGGRCFAASATVMAREKCDVDLSFLPIKLQQTLMPFQKEGIKFAIRKNGR